MAQFLIQEKEWPFEMSPEVHFGLAADSDQQNFDTSPLQDLCPIREKQTPTLRSPHYLSRPAS